jgi:DNA polymerase-3 subunit beta
VRFTFDSTVLISRLIEETYPNYESVIPTDNTKVLTVRREDLIATIRRVALYSSAATHQIRLSVSASTVEVSAQDVDFGGEAKETLAGTFTGEPLEIGFNATYLVDILAHLDSGDVELKFSTPTRAAVITPAGDGGQEEDVLMLVMPVRLSS